MAPKDQANYCNNKATDSGVEVLNMDVSLTDTSSSSTRQRFGPSSKDSTQLQLELSADPRSDENEEDDEEKSLLQSMEPGVSSHRWTASMKESCSPSKGSFTSMLLVLLVFQATAAILTGRYTRSSVPEDELYEISHLVLVIECVKFMASIVLEHFTTGGKVLDSMEEHIWQRPLDTLKVLVPAVLYVVQNSLTYIALSNLSAPVYISLQQGKLISTAIVSVFMLQRSYSIKQWICLVALALGVAIVAMDEKKEQQLESAVEDTDSLVKTEGDGSSPPEQFFLLGFMAVTAASFSSAFAGVYFEKVLAPEKAAKSKTASDEATTDDISTPKIPSLWVRNLQLAFFSMIFAFLQGRYEASNRSNVSLYNEEMQDGSDDFEVKSFFHGFTAWVWLLVVLQAFGGLLVAAVMKYADNVLKGLATGISVVLSSALSMILFDVHLSSQFALGASIILASVYFFSNDPPPLACIQPREGSQ